MTQLPSKNHPLGQQYRHWIHWPEVPQKDEDQLPEFVPIHQFNFNIPTEIFKTGLRGHLAKMQKTAILSFYTYYREDQSSTGWGTELPLHRTSGSVYIQVYSLWTTLRAVLVQAKVCKYSCWEEPEGRRKKNKQTNKKTAPDPNPKIQSWWQNQGLLHQTAACPLYQELSTYSDVGWWPLVLEIPGQSWFHSLYPTGPMNHLNEPKELPTKLQTESIRGVCHRERKENRRLEEERFFQGKLTQDWWGSGQRRFSRPQWLSPRLEPLLCS